MNQFGLMPGRSTIEAIYLIRCLMEEYQERRKDLHMMLIDLEKAYDSVPQAVLWRCLTTRGILVVYIGPYKICIQRWEHLLGHLLEMLEPENIYILTH